MQKFPVNTEPPSVNSSVHRVNYPSLSHKTSESRPKERLVELGSLPHLNDNQTVTDCSSAGRFFMQSLPKTARANTLLAKIPKALQPRDTFLNKSCDIPKGIDLVSIWDIAERVDTYKLRIDAKQVFPKTIESLNSQLSLWGKCCGEIGSLIKTSCASLSNSLSLVHSQLFSLFEDFNEIFKATQLDFHQKFESLNKKHKDQQQEITALIVQNGELIASFAYEENKIKQEVEEMFPNYDEEIKKFKEESQNLRNKKYGVLPDALEKIFRDMSQDQPIPEATELDLAGMNADELFEALREKYRMMITATVKTVKKQIIKPQASALKETQTEAAYIDPKDYEGVCRQMEKMTLSYQNATIKLENKKDEALIKEQVNEKNEGEKQQIRNECLQLRREIELLHREIAHLKFELETKKEEIEKIKKQSYEKIEMNIGLEERVNFLSEKILDLTYELERAKKSGPPSQAFSRRMTPVHNEEEHKRTRLDEVTKAGLTAREEIERTFQRSLQEIRSKRLLELEGKEESMKSHDKEEVKERKNAREEVNENQNTKESINAKENAKQHTKEKEDIKEKRNFKENLKENINEKAKEKVKLIPTTKAKESLIKTATPIKTLDVPKAEMPEEATISVKIPDLPEDNECASSEVETSRKLELHEKKSKKPIPKPTKRVTSIEELSKTTRSVHDQSIEKNTKAQSSILSQYKSEEIQVKLTETFHSEKSKNQPKKVPEKKIERAKETKKAHIKDTKPSAIKDTSVEKLGISKESPGKRSSDSENNTNKISISHYDKEGGLIPEEEDELYPVNLPKLKESMVKKFISASPVKEQRIKVLEKLVKSGKDSCIDKMCGNDYAFEAASIGVQVNLLVSANISAKEEDKFEVLDRIEQKNNYFFPYNPNNIYGLRGDVYYQKAAFQPQPRIPDLTASVMFSPAYKLGP